MSERYTGPDSLGDADIGADNVCIESASSQLSLLNSNPYLRNAGRRKAALRITAASSSAVEGIRQPFKDMQDAEPRASLTAPLRRAPRTPKSGE
jgi:hypothetical protein